MWDIIVRCDGFDFSDCPECGDEVLLLGVNKYAYDPYDENLTEGQMAEQIAAKKGGPFDRGVHGEYVRLGCCPNCHSGISF